MRRILYAFEEIFGKPRRPFKEIRGDFLKNKEVLQAYRARILALI